MQMTCPKCRGDMHQYERNGVTVDQCTECRGLFLDRGELERLVDAEKAWQASRPTPQPGYQQPSSPPQSGYQGGYQQHGGYQQPHYDDHGQHKQHKKKHDSFFEDLFG